MSIGLALAALGAAALVIAIVVRRVAAVDDAREQVHADAERDHMRMRQAARLPGASPERPIEVASPAAVEARAEAIACPRCGGPCHVEEHVVEIHGDVRLRVAKMRCGGCGRRRPVYMQLRESPLLN